MNHIFKNPQLFILSKYIIITTITSRRFTKIIWMKLRKNLVNKKKNY